MAFFFTPPTVLEAWPNSGRLLSRYKIPRGITVLRKDGVYVEVRYPSQDELAAATEVYMGGHRTEVTAAQKAALEAAGYFVETPAVYDIALYDVTDSVYF